MSVGLDIDFVNFAPQSLEQMRNDHPTGSATGIVRDAESKRCKESLKFIVERAAVVREVRCDADHVRRQCAPLRQFVTDSLQRLSAEMIGNVVFRAIEFQ